VVCFVADDAGALLVRSGLVSSTALDDARARVEAQGGTVGEQLVVHGAVGDDALTDFYKSRLLVPQVNPNTLARLPAKVIAAIPADLAIELRAIPVSVDKHGNITVAMGDPSDSHAVDEIASVTGSYVVRAVATQMQIAWCLAHYYGHVTVLGQRLLQGHAAHPSSERVVKAAVKAPAPAAKPAAAPAADAPAPAEPPASETADTPPSGSAPLATTDAISDGIPQATPSRASPGEIRAPRAASVKPPLLEEGDGDDDDEPVVVRNTPPELSGPVISIEVSDEDPTAESPPAPPVRKRKAKTDPPELAARAGEIGMKAGSAPKVEEQPSIVIAEEAFEDPRAKELPPASGELAGKATRDQPVTSGSVSVEVGQEPSEAVVIHQAAQEESAPIILERRRASDAPADGPTEVRKPLDFTDEEPTEDVVVLDSKKPRVEKRTQVGVGAVAAVTRKHDTDVIGVPDSIEDAPTDASRVPDIDATTVDLKAAPPTDDYTPSDGILAAPPRPHRVAPPAEGDDDDDDVAPPPAATPAKPSGQVRLDGVVERRRSHNGDDSDDEDDDIGRATSVMSSVELDEVIPERKAEVMPAHLERGRIDYDPLDDGWGPPGSTIPPPLLGAIPGSLERQSGMIPIPNLDDTALIVAPPSPPEAAPVVELPAPRALEEAIARVLDLIHQLDQAKQRDDVVALMVAHLAETHRRSGFFAMRGGELTLFSMTPKPLVTPYTTLRLDRPSTLQDVIGTRLPYRGPILDETSRAFLGAVLGAPPPEILLVPVAVRDRVVGVLFGEHRLRHTFDDQLALASRAAGNALERILKAKK
jgi:hypothetical protein